MKRYKVKRRDYPDTCPKCGTDNIEYWGIEAFGGGLADAGSCKECDFTWSPQWKYVKWVPTGKYAESPSNTDKETSQ